MATATLPPALVAAEADSESDQASQHCDSAEESELHLRLQAQGPGLAALGASGYADDTQAVAPGTAALQRTAPTTEAWLTLTGQDVRVDKSCSWSQGEGGAQAVLLRGLPIPAADCFRELGVDVAVGGARSTGPVLARRLEAGRSVLRRLPHLPTFQRRVHAVSTLVTPLSLHGVAFAPVTDRDLKGLETMVLQAVWGATRLSRAKEVVFVVLTQGHRISPVMHTRYLRVLWMTRWARSPGPVQVLVQAIWESGLRPPTTGPFRARPARGPPAGLATTGGLVVMDCAGPDGAAALGAGAHPADPAQGAGQPALSCHARAGGPPPGNLWRTGGRGRRGGLSRGTPGSIHRAGGLAPAGLVGRGAVDGGPRARAQHAGHVKLPRLRLTARG